jgi:hypothetical protein
MVSILKALGSRGALVVCGVRGPVLSLFQLTRMDKVFTLAAGRDEGTLVLDLRTPGRAPTGIVDLEDRVGALGGALAIDGPKGATHVRLELPCA